MASHFDPGRPRPRPSVGSYRLWRLFTRPWGDFLNYFTWHPSLVLVATALLHIPRGYYVVCPGTLCPIASVAEPPPPPPPPPIRLAVASWPYLSCQNFKSDPKVELFFTFLFSDDDVMTYPKVTSSHGPDGCSVTVARINTDHSRPGLGLQNRIINVDFRKDESAPGRSQFSKRQ